MTLKDLEYFETIARYRSITRAAAELFIAQPALSQCLQKLEKETGLQLFTRQSRGVALTPQGECFLSFARNVLREHAEMELRMQDVAQGEKGEIRLGFTGAQATHVLPHILPDFQAAHPGISIFLIEATSNDIEQKLLAHEVDVGILHLPILCDELDWFELSRDEMVIIPRTGADTAPHAYEKEGRNYLRPSFFQNEPLILTPPEQRSRMICDRMLAHADVTAQIKQVSRNLSTLDALAQVDYASTFLPEKQISPALRSRGFYYMPPRYSVPYTFVVATLKDGYLSTAVKKLCQALREKQFTF